MHQDNHVSKKTINITGVTKESPAIQLALEHYRKGWVIKIRRIKGRLYLYARKYDKTKKERVWKYLSPITEEEVKVLKEIGIILLDDKNIVETCRELIAKGWELRVKRRKGTTYISARKWINGRRKEIYVSKVSPNEVEELRKLGLLGLGNPGFDSRDVTCVTAVPKTAIVPNHCSQSDGFGNINWEQLETGNHQTGNNKELEFVPEWMLKGVVALLLRLKGYYVVEEKKFSLQRIDIYAEKGDVKLVIEIESSKDSFRDGLRQLSHVLVDLGNEAKYILVLPSAKEEIRKQVESLGFELWTLDDILRQLCEVKNR